MAHWLPVGDGEQLLVDLHALALRARHWPGDGEIVRHRLRQPRRAGLEGGIARIEPGMGDAGDLGDDVIARRALRRFDTRRPARHRTVCCTNAARTWCRWSARVSAGLCCTGTFISLATLSSDLSFSAWAVKASALAASSLPRCSSVQAAIASARTWSSGLSLGGVTPFTLTAIIVAALGGEGIVVLAHFCLEQRGQEFRIGRHVRPCCRRARGRSRPPRRDGRSSCRPSCAAALRSRRRSGRRHKALTASTSLLAASCGGQRLLDVVLHIVQRLVEPGVILVTRSST